MLHTVVRLVSCHLTAIIELFLANCLQANVAYIWTWVYMRLFWLLQSLRRYTADSVLGCELKSSSTEGWLQRIDARFCVCCALCIYVLTSMNVITTTPQKQDDNLSCEGEGSRFKLQCRQKMEGARTLSKHCPGTLEQGSRPINAQTGSCDELATHPGANLPSPMWAPSPEKEEKSSKRGKWGRT